MQVENLLYTLKSRVSAAYGERVLVEIASTKELSILISSGIEHIHKPQNQALLLDFFISYNNMILALALLSVCFWTQFGKAVP